jgi:hypothetical protein
MPRPIALVLLLSSALLADLKAADAINVSRSSQPSENVNVAINNAGEIGAVWVEKFSSTDQRIFFSIFSKDSWSAPGAIPGQSGVSSNPRIAKGIAGGFVAAWHDQTTQCIRFSQYQGSWSTPITVSQIGGYDFGWPAITTTTNGRIAVSWMRGNPAFSDIYVTIFDTSWSGPSNISNTPYGSKYCDLAGGPNGEIYAIWQDDRGDDFFRPLLNNDQGSGQWQRYSEINDIQGWCFRPVLAVNAQNEILSCYYFHNGAGFYGSYYLGGTWLDPTLYSDVGNHQDHDFYFSDLCPLGENGFLFVYRDCGLNIFYTAAMEGKPGSMVQLTNSGDCYAPSIDYHPSVGAVAAWSDRSAGNDVFAIIFDPQGGPIGEGIQPPTRVTADYRSIALAPSDMTAEPVVNRNLFTVQYFWRISWSPDSRWGEWGLNLAKYRVYRKLKASAAWQLHAEVGPNELSYIDRDGVSKDDRFDYKVRGVDELGNEYYAYNRISWAANPLNTERQITVQGYNVYRRLAGQSSASFVLWKSVDAATLAWEDHATEIRQQTNYEYALTAVSDKGKESAKAVAQKVISSALKPGNN